MKPTDRLETGEVGYIITGVKDVAQVRVGDTITDRKRPAGEALPGYKVVQPMVFTGLFPTEGDKFEELRDALEKLKLNDAALSYEPESRSRSASASAAASSACCTWTSCASAWSASTASS